MEDTRIFGAMQSGTPHKSFIKTILGKVYMNILNPFDGKPTGILLSGDPTMKQETCILDVWSEKEYSYVKTMNKIHFETGTVIDFARPTEQVKEKTVEEYSDEELEVVINSKFLALQSILNKTESTPVLFRMVSLAKKMEKSEKIVGAIEARLSEVQLND